MRPRASQKRGPTLTMRMRLDSHQKFIELVARRLMRNENALKGDIISSAIDDLYEKELGKK